MADGKLNIFDQVVHDQYALYNGDSCEVLQTIPDNSVHLSVYSPPFRGLYHYSSSERDLSNCENSEAFFQHYNFIIAQKYRITLPGRITAVHCADVPTGNTGVDALMDFPGDIIEHHVRCQKENCDASDYDKRRGLCGHGWFEYTGRYHVWKEPLGVRNRTMAKNLAHQTIVEDSSRCSVAGADYVLTFRKKGKNPIPIEHPHGLTEYAGSRQIPQELWKYRGHKGKQTENRFSHWIWRQYASAFWDDIRGCDGTRPVDDSIRAVGVLPFKESREEDDEKHVHPLQLDVIDRIVTLWSNPGEVVLTPFMGVGSEVYGAVINNRKAIGIELKQSYFKQAIKNVADAFVKRPGQLELF